MKLIELREEYAAKSKQLKAVFDEAGPDMDFTKVKSLDGDTKGKVEKVNQMNAELADLHRQIQEQKKLEDIAGFAKEAVRLSTEPAGNIPHPAEETKSIGKLIMEQEPGKKLRPGGPSIDLLFDAKRLLGIEVKTLFDTTAGWAPESIRIPGYILSPARAITVVDNIPQIPTTQAAVVYMLESTATFNAAEKAEAAAYAESAFVLTETTETVRKITTSLPVTDEQLADVPAAEAYLNQRLSYDIRRRLDLQVLEGNGVAPNLKGTLNIGGALNSQALGTDPVPDALYKAFDLIRTTGFTDPTVLFINPTDWQPVVLLRTADGIYVFGGPVGPGPREIWGVPVVVTTAVTANTALCGDYRGYSALYVRQGLELSMGYVNDDFTKGKKTIRVDMRCAMVHFRAAAFAKITGL